MVTQTAVTLSDLLDATVRRHADRPFLLRESGTMPYGEFGEKVGRLAASLAELGVGHGEKVAVVLPNGEVSLALWFALARLGAVTVPLNPALVPAEIVPLLRRIGARKVISDAARLGRYTRELELPLRIAVGDGAERGMVPFADLLSKSAAPPPDVAAGEDPVSVLFTSGTTGRPKGSLLTHTTYVLPAREFERWMKVTPDDRFLGSLPLFHMAGQAFAASAVGAGAALALVDQFHGSRFWSVVRRHRVTLTRYLGEMLAVLCQRPVVPEERGHSLRAVYGGGTTARVAEQFERRFGATVVEGYGLTETNTVLRNELDARRSGSIGRPLPYSEIRITDESGEALPPGERGEILVRRNPVMMQGYFEDPELTGSVFADGWFRTGDLGYQDADGYVFFVGRRKNIIRRRGENISPQAVEEVLGQHPAVELAAVVGVPDEVGGEEVKACLVCRDGAEVTPGELVDWCHDYLAEFEIPRFFEFRDELPKTATLKINRALLETLVRSNRDCYDRKATTSQNTSHCPPSGEPSHCPPSGEPSHCPPSGEPDAGDRGMTTQPETGREEHRLERVAYTLRQHIVRMAADSPGAHLGGSMSAVEILTVLLFDGVVRIDPQNPGWDERDYLIFSKGHASAALYAALAERGFFPVEELEEYKRSGGRLAGHPSKGIPGVELATGSLGHGLSVANGLALAARHDKLDYRIFVILGDGECQEGSIWEAAMTAAHYKLDNVVAIVDRNGVQEDGPTEEIMALEPFADKWRAFGWEVVEVDGHDPEALREPLHNVPLAPGKPSVVIARTVKGKGVSFAENTNVWHYGKLTTEQRAQAMADLGDEP